VLLAAGTGDERAEAIRIFEEAVEAAPADGVLRAQLQNELDSIRRRIECFLNTDQTSTQQAWSFLCAPLKLFDCYIVGFAQL